MIRIYTKLSHYNPDKRKYLPDILRPFLPQNRFAEFGIDNNVMELVTTIEESHICLLPMAWNYYLNTNQINRAEKLIIKAQLAEKKILIWISGDYFIPLPNYKYIIILHAGPYQSIQNV